MHRRRFIRSSLGVLLAFAVTQKLSLFSRVVCAESALTERLSRLFTYPENARVVGQSYLDHYPQRADVNLLLNALGASMAMLATTGDAALLNHLNVRRQQDFVVGDTVIVDNWILSRTEASVCALLTLS